MPFRTLHFLKKVIYKVKGQVKGQNHVFSPFWLPTPDYQRQQAQTQPKHCQIYGKDTDRALTYTKYTTLSTGQGQGEVNKVNMCNMSCDTCFMVSFTIRRRW